jgi:hypothetical protein
MPMSARPGVYRTPLALFVLGLAWLAPHLARAQVDITVDPAMVKGAPSARVTIYEFSDYE